MSTCLFQSSNPAKPLAMSLTSIAKQNARLMLNTCLSVLLNEAGA